jgi:hypothetical protein
MDLNDLQYQTSAKLLHSDGPKVDAIVSVTTHAKRLSLVSGRYGRKERKKERIRKCQIHTQQRTSEPAE